MPRPMRKRKRVELTYIGEVHGTNPELNVMQRTFGRAHAEIEKAKQEGKRVIVTLELPHETVEKLKTLRSVEVGINPEHIKQALGFYIPVEDIVELVKKHKDVEFRGIDLDTYINPTDETVRKSIEVASKNGFIKKALDPEVYNKLSKEEKAMLFGNIISVLARNEVMKNNLKQIVEEGKHDKIVHIGGSAHSSIVAKLKKEMNSVELKTSIKHTLREKFKNTVGEMTGKKSVNFIFQPHDVLIRSIYSGHLDHLDKKRVLEILRQTNKMTGNAVQGIIDVRNEGRRAGLDAPEYLDYILGVTGIKNGKLSVETSETSRMAKLIRKMKGWRKHN